MRRLKTHLDVALCSEVINLLRLSFLQDADQICRVSHAGINIDIVDATGVEGLGATLDAVDYVTFIKKKAR